MIVEVALPLPVDRTYSYAVPDALCESVEAGVRVLVPFGSRRLTGVVVACCGSAPAATPLKPVEDILDDRPALTDEMLRLTRWMSGYYVCSWGEAIRAALPPGIDVESQWVVQRTSAPVPDDLPEIDRRLLARLPSDAPVPLRSLQPAEPSASLARIRRLERRGVVKLQTELRKERARPKTAWHLQLAPSFRAMPELESLKQSLRGDRQVGIVSLLAEQHSRGRDWLPQAGVLKETSSTASSLKSLEERAIIRRAEREVMRNDDQGEDAGSIAPHALHPAQERALAGICEAVAAGTYAAFLLHGVTGSGKTEVYIEALKATLRSGRSGIVLVPEIALTPQTVGRFRAHFGDDVAVLHSRMSVGERFDAWRQLRDGQYRVAIGPRSAVLAPLENVGLIIVDEEHESSYKQADPAPRYHARDVAVMRAHLTNAVCILGSATPSLESWVNAVESGKYRLLEMPDRVPVPGLNAAPLPDVRVVDLVRERKRHQLDGVFSRALLNAISERLSQKEQVILLQNRRGFAPVVECRKCGWVPECPDCSVSFTYHKASRQLKCHYCGRTRRMPQRCDECAGDELGQLGTGTQRVEEELRAHLPDARIIRMDLDTTARKRAHHRLLTQFRKGEADILLGTQMVAKGLDFPNVTLVGVINADTGLLLPDFRADENTFQLLTQVAGRAGRAGLRGEVVLQTRNAENSVLRRAAAHDYRGFVDAVLDERRAFRWPPFARLIVVAFSGPDERRVHELARTWTDLLRQRAPDLQVLDTVPALVGRVKRRHRYRTLIKAPRGRAQDVQDVLREVMRDSKNPPAGYRIAIDVDAVDVL